jgi:hypothetical protein
MQKQGKISEFERGAKVAEQLLKCDKLLNKNGEYPTDVYFLAGMLGMGLVEKDMTILGEKDSYDISGFITKNQGEQYPTIYINMLDSKYRKRYTVARMIAHYLQNWEEFTAGKTKSVLDLAYEYKNYEWAKIDRRSESRI